MSTCIKNFPDEKPNKSVAYNHRPTAKGSKTVRDAVKRSVKKKK